MVLGSKSVWAVRQQRFDEWCHRPGRTPDPVGKSAVSVNVALSKLLDEVTIPGSRLIIDRECQAPSPPHLAKPASTCRFGEASGNSQIVTPPPLFP